MFISGIAGRRRRGEQHGHRNRYRATMGRSGSSMLNFGRSPFVKTSNMTTPLAGTWKKRGDVREAGDGAMPKNAEDKKKFHVTQKTTDAIQNEVMHTLQLPCSIYVMALDLSRNELVMTIHQHSDNRVIESHRASSLASMCLQDPQISTSLATTHKTSEKEETPHTSWTNIVTQNQEVRELTSVGTTNKDSAPGDMSMLLATFGHLNLENNRARKETKCNDDEDVDESVLELKQAFLQLSSSLHATSNKVRTWEEAKDVLGRVIIFPAAEVHVVSDAPPVTALNNIESKSRDESPCSTTPNMNLISGVQEVASAIEQQIDFPSNSSRPWTSSSTRKRRLINQQQGVVVKSANKTRTAAVSRPLFKKHRHPKDRSTRCFQKYLQLVNRTSQQLGKKSGLVSTWRQIQLYPAEKTELGAEVSTNVAKEAMIVGTETLEFQQALKAKLQKEEALEREIEVRMEAEEAPLPPLTPEESAMVQDILYKRRPGTRDDDIISTVGTDTIQRGSIRKLQPAQWLNDEVIHFYLTLLSRRDEAMCAKDTSRKRSHFFKSFFITKLLDDDRAYNYKNVRRWSKKVPGKDIFGLDKIICPVNLGNTHWCCAVIFIHHKKIQFYDSMGGSGRHYINGLFKYVQDEHQDKKKSVLPNKEEWELIECQRETPQQMNGYDCGVFTCAFADFISRDAPLGFTQDHVTELRERIALSIVKNDAMV